ncbi:hypothetical protein JVT61DRAFT_8003 [Boletus reticuloceps]|uniref:Uncharacterized protein n=1 Tax=Boletus reticuloceps TaxID=495285 RepID=A0A8I2YHZ5_9AGAM|nr:hypothetical protein JVT61DRAFT_8003 [Boletus reticuloceps]
MDFFSQLNYRYPGASNATRPHGSQQPHVPVPLVQSIQDHAHPGDVYAPSGTRRIPHLDVAASHELGPQQQNTIPGVRGVEPHRPMSDKITCADHRPLDRIFGNLHPLSGLSQATSSPLHPSQNLPPRGQPQHTSVLTYALPTKPQLDGVIQIPLLAVDNQISGTGLVVNFRCSDWGIGILVEGIPMSDLLHSNVSALEDPHERVLDGFGFTNLRFNILWPHYPPFVKVMSAFGRDGKPMTRAELGYEVSLAFAEFIFLITSRSIPPAQPGPYAIALSPGSSSPGITFEKLHLITVRNTSRGEWMAEIRAVLVP